jgi:hypothetical protein
VNTRAATTRAVKTLDLADNKRAQQFPKAKTIVATLAKKNQQCRHNPLVNILPSIPCARSVDLRILVKMRKIVKENKVLSLASGEGTIVSARKSALPSRLR